MIRHGLAPSCDLVAPGRIPHGPGWYLAAANLITEAGPFSSESNARAAGRWLREYGYGVNPAPYTPFYSAKGVTIGIRRKESPTTTESENTPHVDHHSDWVPVGRSGD